jgi:hypothetical protein
MFKIDKTYLAQIANAKRAECDYYELGFNQSLAPFWLLSSCWQSFFKRSGRRGLLK